MNRQLLYSSVYLAWTALLLVGVLALAIFHLAVGGILTMLWATFLAALGLRVGRFGVKETIRQIYALGLPFTVLWMLLPVVAWRMCLRRIRPREAVAQIRLLFHQLTAVAMQELSEGGGQSTALRPFVSTALSLIWAGMFVLSLLVLFGIHINGGFYGWFWLFLGAGVWYFWYYVGKRGLAAAFAMAVRYIAGLVMAVYRFFSGIIRELTS